MKRMSVGLDKDLVKKKLKKEFNKELFMGRVQDKEQGWSAELETCSIPPVYLTGGREEKPMVECSRCQNAL